MGLVAIVRVCKLANLLLVMVPFFNQALTVWRAFCLCMINCRLCFLYLFVIKNKNKRGDLGQHYPC